MKRALLVLLLTACSRRTPEPAAAAPAAAAADAGLEATSPEWARRTLSSSCQSCHSLRLIDQQRLTRAQWERVLEKMVGWGAFLEVENIPPFAESLAREHGPEAALPVAARIDAAAAAQSFAVLDDGAFARGDAAQGEQLFKARCAFCHAADARGAMGVNLVDRLLLQRAAELAGHVRAGRGQMPPNPDLTDAQVGHLLAWLRAL